MDKLYPRFGPVADLVYVALAALLCLLLQLVGLLHGLVGVCLGLLLVFILPGYAVASLLLPDRLERPLDRVALIMGLSLVVAILSGVMLNLAPAGIRASSSTLCLAGISLVACSAAIARRLSKPDQSGQPLSLRAARAQLHFVRRNDIVLGAAAIVVVAAAIGVAVYSASQRTDSGFTQLWIQPVELPHRSAFAPQQPNGQVLTAPATVEIAIRSEELTTRAYTIEVYAGVRLAQAWDNISLAPGQSWQRNVTFPVVLSAPQVRTYVTLVRLDRPGVYRHVILWIRP
jgi:uncharacterized membrane protein